MNIFYLHNSPREAARLHCDKHVVKMILETAQILSTVHHLRGSPERAPYKKTHEHHPSVRWAAENRAQYFWLLELGVALCREYTARYGREHACQKHLTGPLAELPAAFAGQTPAWRDPPQAMPEDCRQDDAVSAYRKYYRTYKATFAKWRNGATPEFMFQPT